MFNECANVTLPWTGTKVVYESFVPTEIIITEMNFALVQIILCTDSVH